MKNLKHLDVSPNSIKEIPNWIGTLTRLSFLDISANSIGELPDGIGKLVSLTNLNISKNIPLMRLTSSITSLNLERFECNYCYNLIEPPYAVCQGGFSDVKQYYKDLDDGKDTMTLSTVVLIGRKEAGKSTLLNAVKQSSEICSGHNVDIIGDGRKNKDNAKQGKETTNANKDDGDGGNQVEKTKVFDFKEIIIGDRGRDKRSINVIDFGGDEAYHYAYQLTFRRDCIPIVVVNVCEYESSRIHGPREATRRVAFDWLSHLIKISERKLKPILVFTHQDKYQDKTHIYERLTKEIRSTLCTLTKEICGAVGENRTAFYTPNDFSFGFTDNSSTEKISETCEKLKAHIQECSKEFECSIPSRWLVQIDDVLNNTCSILDFLELKSKTTDSKVLEIVLNFMKRSGKILWYIDKDNDALKNVIFHNVKSVRNLIGSLYDHTMQENVVMKRVAAGDLSMDQLHNSFLCQGIVNEPKLEQLISMTPLNKQQTENPPRIVSPPIPFKIAVALLREFKLLYGPTVINNTPDCYLMPYFMQKHEFPVHSSEIALHATMEFVGLRLPVYAFHQMTVAFLRCISSRTSYQIFPYGNGASAKLDASDEKSQDLFDAHLIHDIDSQRVCIKVLGAPTVIHDLWLTFCTILKEVSKECISAWAATRIVYDIPCPHCLIIDRPNPALLDPGKIIDRSIFSDDNRAQSEKRIYQRCVDTPAIPNALTSM